MPIGVAGIKLTNPSAKWGYSSWAPVANFSPGNIEEAVRSLHGPGPHGGGHILIEVACAKRERPESNWGDYPPKRRRLSFL